MKESFGWLTETQSPVGRVQALWWVGGSLGTQLRIYMDSSNTVQFLHTSWVWFLHASLALSKHFPFLSLILSSVFIIRPEGAEWIRTNKTIKPTVKCKVFWFISCLVQRNSRTIAWHKLNFLQIWIAVRHTAHYGNTIHLWGYLQWPNRMLLHRTNQHNEPWLEKKQRFICEKRPLKSEKGREHWGFVVVVELWFFSCWPFQGQLG